MCKIANTNLAIKHLDFSSERGKFMVDLSDGRRVIVSIVFFHNIKQLSVNERKK